MAARGLLGLAALMTLSGCATRGAVPRPFPLPSAPVPQVARPTAPGFSTGYALARTALSFQGIPYRSGGADPSGFDCSGFVQYVFARHQIDVPREVRDQFQSGRPIDAQAIEAGDLLFFATTGSGVSHVALAIGADQFVHAPSSRGSVRVERLSLSYWGSRFMGARRVLESDGLRR